MEQTAKYELTKHETDRQCTLCKYEKLDADDSKCKRCMEMKGKPNFEVRINCACVFQTNREENEE